jgi:hypothetical protein
MWQAGGGKQFEDILDDQQGLDTKLKEVAAKCASRLACWRVAGDPDFNMKSLAVCQQKLNSGRRNEDHNVAKALRLNASAFPEKVHLLDTPEWLGIAVSWFSKEAASPLHGEAVLLLNCLRTFSSLPGLMLTTPGTACVLCSTISQGSSRLRESGLHLLDQMVIPAVEQLEGGALLHAAKAWLMELQQEGIVKALVGSLRGFKGSADSLDTVARIFATLSTLPSCFQDMKGKDNVQALVKRVLFPGHGQEHIYLLLEGLLCGPVEAHAFQKSGGYCACMQVLRKREGQAVCLAVMRLLGHWAMQSYKVHEAFYDELDASPLVRLLECQDKEVVSTARLFLSMYFSDAELFNLNARDMDGPLRTIKSMLTSPVYGSAELLGLISRAMCGVVCSEESANVLVDAGLVTHIAQTLQGNSHNIDFEGLANCLAKVLGNSSRGLAHVLNNCAGVVVPLMLGLEGQQEKGNPYCRTPGVVLVIEKLVKSYKARAKEDKDCKSEDRKDFCAIPQPLAAAKNHLTKIFQSAQRLTLLLEVIPWKIFLAPAPHLTEQPSCSGVSKCDQDK